jgi:hypothetical protein
MRANMITKSLDAHKNKNQKTKVNLRQKRKQDAFELAELVYSMYKKTNFDNSNKNKHEVNNV